MKQIDIIKTYSQKRCLVVDDVPDVRTSLKRLLVDFGSEDVDTAGNAEEAIDLCQKKQYDIVLADYNLGPGKNGQQLLEELRFHKLLGNSALYIMITAESASHYVLHALEYQPDDYLNKPINRDSLRPRLDAALLKNEALMPVKKAMDANNPSVAINTCHQLIEKGQPRYQNDTRKILADLLCQHKKYAKALAVYDELPADRTPVWAQLGKARAHFGLKHYDEAEHILNTLINDVPLCVDAHDLLAKVYEARNDYDQAQHALSTAVKISPRSAPRQRELGRVSHESGDETASVHAYRTAVRHSKNSCHETAEDFLALAQVLTNLADQPGAEKSQLTGEALEALRYADKKYGSHPIVQMRSKFVEADINKNQGKHDLADKLIEDAQNIYSNMKYSALKNTPTQLCIDCAKAFMDHGFYDEGEKLLQVLAKNNPHPEFTLKIDKLLREPLTKEGIQYAAQLNREGIGYYQKQAFDKAITAFVDVLRELPNHIGLNLNLIQAIISKNKGSNINDKELQLLDGCFLRVGTIAKDSEYSKRYEYLVKRYQLLKNAAVKN